MPDMAKIYDRNEKLKKSLKGFEKLIEKHVSSETKDEKDIHKYLTEHYWLLGIQYFGMEIYSDINIDGQRTNMTNIGRKHADFIIKRLDGYDFCTIIEIEEANDPVFNKNRTLSRGVYDGIMQAADYCIEQQMKGDYSKGIAVVGSLPAGKLLKEQKDRLRYLAEHFPKIEVLTYDDIIDRAKRTLTFLEEYKNQEL